MPQESDDDDESLCESVSSFCCISPHRYDYVAPAYLESIYPTSGPEVGGTVVTVAGRHFVNTAHLTCRFEDEESAMDMVVEARWISSEELRCVTREATTPGVVVAVSVSLNGQEYVTSGGASFKFQKKVQ